MKTLIQTKSILWVLGALIIGMLHVACQPSSSIPKTAYVIELERMLANCQDEDECQATQNVLDRANGKKIPKAKELQS